MPVYHHLQCKDCGFAGPIRQFEVEVGTLKTRCVRCQSPQLRATNFFGMENNQRATGPLTDHDWNLLEAIADIVAPGDNVNAHTWPGVCRAIQKLLQYRQVISPVGISGEKMNEALIVLTELVALKEMKTQAEALLYYDTDTEGNRRSYQSVKPHDKPKYDALMAQYMARKDAAWQQAAAVVKASK